MAITIKSAREIELMTEAGRILEIVHNELEKALHPGMSTKDIDRLGEDIIRSYGCIPSFLGYDGYPASICVSVNDEVVHGIPDKHRILKEGDIVSLDAGEFRVGKQSEGQSVLFFKFLMGRHAVLADAEHYRALFLKLRIQLAKVARLLCASRRVVLRVKV